MVCPPISTRCRATRPYPKLWSRRPPRPEQLSSLEGYHVLHLAMGHEAQEPPPGGWLAASLR